jgi:tetratricopeptide (TPR) repeat protein
MKRINIKILLFGLILLFSGNYAQSKRSLINDGIDSYNKNDFNNSEIKFKKAIKEDGSLFEGYFNLGDAHYKKKEYDEAAKSYQKALSVAKIGEQKSMALHNMGNISAQNQKYEDAVKSYISALKENPRDAETKYNLSYALKQIKKNKDNQQNKNDKNQNKDNKDKNQDNKQNQNDKNKDKNQDKDKKNDQNKDDNDKNKQNDNQNEQQKQKNQINKKQAEQILSALKNNEKDLQKKLRKKVGKPIQTEKDW